MGYDKIGLKVGIEIHQQLDTKKLFCNCPSILREDKPHFTVRRELRASKGETEEIDVAASHETKKQKYFLYEGYYDTTCLVELDEEPPHNMNKDALNVVLQIAKMFQAKIVDEVQVMRKMVVNGSNTSGFQRTAIVAMDGKILINNNQIGIAGLFIEEEAAKDVEKTDDYVKYRLDRLGIPLIEIATTPDIKTPEQAKEVCEKIGMYLRSTGKVKRGIGTIRQDINISIAGGERIEIKGAQELKLIPDLINNEIKRQQNLLKIKEKLKERNAKKIEANKLKIVEITEILKNTKVAFIKKDVDTKKQVYAIKLDHFADLIKLEEVKNQRLGFEFATFARMLGFGGLIHSDENLEKYGFLDEEIKKIKKILNIQSNDAFLFCVGAKEKVETLFLHYVIPRANEALIGVPKEVRNANPDGTTTFMRPMPGGARMYPETDVLPIKPDLKNIVVPELIDDKKDRIEKYGLSSDLANLIAKSGRADEFEEYISRFKNLKPSFIAESMIPKMLEIKRKHNVDVEKLKKESLIKIFELINDLKISKKSFEEIIVEVIKGKSVDLVIKEKDLALYSEKELTEKIKELVAQNKNLEEKYLLGKLMGALSKKAESEKIIEILKKVL